MSMFVTGSLELLNPRVAIQRDNFSSEEHDMNLIRLWQEQVTNEDQVWVLGNLSSTNPEGALAILEDLPGTKHLIVGNRDLVSPSHKEAWKCQADYFEVFQSIQTVARRRLHGRDCFLSHYRPPLSGSAQWVSPMWRPQAAPGFWVYSDEDLDLDRVPTKNFPQFGAQGLNVSWGTWGDLVPWEEVKLWMGS